MRQRLTWRTCSQTPAPRSVDELSASCLHSDHGRLEFSQGQLKVPVARAAKAGMDPKTARKYLRDRCLPSEMREKHTWRTRPDPFADSWDEIQQLLAVEPGYRRRRSSSICSRFIRAGSVTARYGHCGAGLATGERPKGRHARRSLRRSIGRGVSKL